MSQSAAFFTNYTSASAHPNDLVGNFASYIGGDFKSGPGGLSEPVILEILRMDEEAYNSVQRLFRVKDENIKAITSCLAADIKAGVTQVVSNGSEHTVSVGTLKNWLRKRTPPEDRYNRLLNDLYNNRIMPRLSDTQGITLSAFCTPYAVLLNHFDSSIRYNKNLFESILRLQLALRKNTEALEQKLQVRSASTVPESLSGNVEAWILSCDFTNANSNDLWSVRITSCFHSLTTKSVVGAKPVFNESLGINLTGDHEFIVYDVIRSEKGTAATELYGKCIVSIAELFSRKADSQNIVAGRFPIWSLDRQDPHLRNIVGHIFARFKVTADDGFKVNLLSSHFNRLKTVENELSAQINDDVNVLKSFIIPFAALQYDKDNGLIYSGSRCRACSSGNCNIM